MGVIDNKKPKISIIVPIYKVEKYLEKCIDSILEQTFTDFELILVDDGSPDKCGKICDEYELKDNRIKVIHKKNGGLSDARNSGIKIAKGEYLGFIDSDDWINREMYEILYMNAIKYKADIAVCDFRDVQEEYIVKEKLNLVYDIELLSNIETLNKLYTTKTTFVIACNKIYKKELFNNLEYRVGRIYEDEFIIHELIYKSKKVIYINAKLYFYLKRPDSIVGASFTAKKLDKLDARKERIEFFRTIGEKELIFNSEVDYINLLLWNYYIIKSQSEKTYIKKLRKEFNNMFKFIIKNPTISYKFKCALFIFLVSENIYKIFFLDRKIF